MLQIPDMPATVFIVDDDISIREALEVLVRREGLNVETFVSALAFLDCPRRAGPSCLVLDISLPGLTGLELQKKIAPDRSETPIIFITGHGDIPMTVQAMRAGAIEFLTKPLNDDALLRAIHAALDRSKALLLRDAEMSALRLRYAGLTPRERAVMLQVVLGLPNKQIGDLLGISEITVKAHRGNVMRKMEADSVAALVYMAVRLRLTRKSATNKSSIC
ncbi:response regulator transcription factor [Acidicapsa ligni]|uniref:response regulator transcription factor n=1 Tax=Acidicapsa ligni TaxID=542300 RepID=UPI0021DF8A3E|nr:response regulator [Acidicapsa ligni]